MQYEQNKINQMLPKGMRCYHSTEFDTVPRGNYLIIMDIKPYDIERMAFKLELWESDNIFMCTQLNEPPLHSRRIWKGPYEFCLRMLLNHLEYLKDPKRYRHKKSS